MTFLDRGRGRTSSGDRCPLDRYRAVCYICRTRERQRRRRICGRALLTPEASFAVLHRNVKGSRRTMDLARCSSDDWQQRRSILGVEPFSIPRRSRLQRLRHQGSASEIRRSDTERLQDVAHETPQFFLILGRFSVRLREGPTHKY
jgi:hypothetical protein